MLSEVISLSWFEKQKDWREDGIHEAERKEKLNTELEEIPRGNSKRELMSAAVVKENLMWKEELNLKSGEKKKPFHFNWIEVKNFVLCAEEEWVCFLFGFGFFLKTASGEEDENPFSKKL